MQYKNQLILAVTLFVALIHAPPSAANSSHVLSFGASVGKWSPALTTYNDRFESQKVTNLVEYGDGALIPVRIRESIRTKTTFNPGTDAEYVTGPVPFTFDFDWTVSLRLEARHPSVHGLAAVIEMDWWSQRIGGTRNFGGFVGYEDYHIALTPLTFSLLYEKRLQDAKWYWPTMRIGAGAGALWFTQTQRQVTNTTPSGGAVSKEGGNTLAWTGQLGASVTPPQFGERVSFSMNARYLWASYYENFVKLENSGTPVLSSTGVQVRERHAVDVGGPTVNLDITVNIGRKFVRTDAL